METISHRIYELMELQLTAEREEFSQQAHELKTALNELEVMRTKLRTIFNSLFDEALEAERAGNISFVKETLYREPTLYPLPVKK